MPSSPPPSPWPHFYRFSTGLVVVTAVGWGILMLLMRPLNRAIQLHAQTQAARQAQVAVAQLLSSELTRVGEEPFAALEQSLPGPLDLGDFYAWLEGLARADQVELRYNFHPSGGDARGVDDPTTPGMWRISVDFLGPVDRLRSMLGHLENGLYHLSVEYYKLDSTDPQAGQLSLELYLYGQPTNHRA